MEAYDSMTALDLKKRIRELEEALHHMNRQHNDKLALLGNERLDKLEQRVSKLEQREQAVPGDTHECTLRMAVITALAAFILLGAYYPKLALGLLSILIIAIIFFSTDRATKE